MWLLSFLPDWWFYALLTLGLIGIFVSYLMSFIPFVSMYRNLIQATSIVAIVIGTYMAGAISNEDKWQLKIKDLELKISQSETQSAEENIKIVDRIITKKQIVKEKGEEVIKYIDREVVKYDTKFIKGEDCELPDEFFNSLNQAVGEEK
jgi:flagellar motor component MotA